MYKLHVIRHFSFFLVNITIFIIILELLITFKSKNVQFFFTNIVQIHIKDVRTKNSNRCILTGDTRYILECLCMGKGRKRIQLHISS